GTTSSDPAPRRPEPPRSVRSPARCPAEAAARRSARNPRPGRLQLRQRFVASGDGTMETGWMQNRLRRLGVVVAVGLLAAILAAPASASEPISSFATGVSSSQAGGHPDLSVSFALEEPAPTEVAKSAVVGLPAGLVTIPSSAVQ